MMRRSLDFHRTGQIHPAEYDAGIGHGRAQGEVDLVPGMQTDAGGADNIFKTTLPEHATNLFQ
jgi:hypothetical protein